MDNNINKQISELQVINTRQALKFAMPLLVVIFTMINAYAFFTEHDFLMKVFPIISTMIMVGFIIAAYKEFKPRN